MRAVGEQSVGDDAGRAQQEVSWPRAVVARDGPGGAASASGSFFGAPGAAAAVVMPKGVRRPDWGCAAGEEASGGGTGPCTAL